MQCVPQVSWWRHSTNSDEIARWYLAAVGKDKTLHTANLGDSGFLIARAKEGGDTLQLLFKTPFQQHDFNTPFQLSTMGPDEPWHADVEKFQVESGDILVMGTDGLWDNVYDADVLEALSSGSTPQQMADRFPPITAHRRILPPRSLRFY
jgi:protein phosphatase PTC7